MFNAAHNSLYRGKQLKLAERIIRSDTDDDVVPRKVMRPSQYGGYSPEQMDKAISAVLQQQMSIRAAAEMYGVPKSTLGDRISGRVLPGTDSGASRYLADSEEEELVEFIVGCASIGYPKTIKDILVIVQSILASRGINRIITYGWWEAFRRRHPDLTLRVPSSLTKARALASNRVVVDRYFDLLEETLLENDLKDCPCQIFNMDESGMPLDPKSLKTIHVRGDTNPVTAATGDKAQVTIVACVSASGNYIPPMVIWDRKSLKQQWTTGEVAGTLYGMSSKGWMDMSLFEKWFTRHFLRYAPSVRPLLLLMDGHSSHYSPVALQMAAEENVILFALPPNTTHFSQPLDKGVFGPLKVAWRRVCHTYLSENPGIVVTRSVFSQLFNSAWQDAMTSKNIIAGFRTTGVYPTDRYAVALPGESKKSTDSLKEKTRLSFVPFYTPSKQPAFSQEKLPVDPKCKNWRQKYQQEDPASSSDDDSNVPFSANPALGKFFRYPLPPPKKQEKTEVCARVLTSLENLKLLEEKQRAKEEKQRAKEERQRAREEKQREKQREKVEKQKVKQRAKEEKQKSKKVTKNKGGKQIKSQNSGLIEGSSQEDLATKPSKLTLSIGPGSVFHRKKDTDSDFLETPYSDIDLMSSDSELERRGSISTSKSSLELCQSKSEIARKVRKLDKKHLTRENGVVLSEPPASASDLEMPNLFSPEPNERGASWTDSELSMTPVRPLKNKQKYSTAKKSAKIPCPQSGGKRQSYCESDTFSAKTLRSKMTSGIKSTGISSRVLRSQTGNIKQGSKVSSEQPAMEGSNSSSMSSRSTVSKGKDKMSTKMHCPQTTSGIKSTGISSRVLCSQTGSVKQGSKVSSEQLAMEGSNFSSMSSRSSNSVSQKKVTDTLSSKTLRSKMTSGIKSTGISTRVLRSQTGNIKQGSRVFSEQPAMEVSNSSSMSSRSTVSKEKDKMSTKTHCPQTTSGIKSTGISSRVLRSQTDNVKQGSKVSSEQPAMKGSNCSSMSSRSTNSVSQKKGAKDIDVIDLTDLDDALEVKIEYWIKDLQLLESDQKILSEGSELNDRLILAGQSLLSKQFPHINGLQDTMLSNGLRFLPVDQDGVQILHTGSSKHWICTSNVGCGRHHHVNVLDSLGYFMGPLNLEVLLQIAKIYSIPPTEHHLRIKKLSVQQQQGTLDCGLFALAFATEICAGGDVQGACFDQKKMRKHFFRCLVKREMKTFPKTTPDREPFPRPTERLSTYRVYCHCRLLEQYDQRMVECTRCKAWYHITCVGLDHKQIPLQWKCFKCDTK